MMLGFCELSQVHYMQVIDQNCLAEPESPGDNSRLKLRCDLSPPDSQ